MILFVAGYEMPFEDGGDLRAPLRPIRHRRQKLKFKHDAGNAEGDGAAQNLRRHLVVVSHNLRPRCLINIHGRQGEIDFRKDLARADVQTKTASKRMRTDAIDEVFREWNGKCGVIEGCLGNHRLMQSPADS